MRSSLAAVLALVMLVGCTRKDAAPNAGPAGSTAMSAVASASPAADAGPPPATAAGTPALPDAGKAIAFDALQKELDAKCAPKLDASATNLEWKPALAAQGECLKKAYTADLDKVLLPLKDADKPRFDALMKEQAEWNAFEKAACWLAEQAYWVDFQSGTLDDGTARGSGDTACRIRAGTERDAYARMLAAGDATSLSERFEVLDGDGTTQIGRVVFMRVQAAKLTHATPDAAVGFAFPRPLSGPERTDLEQRARDVEDHADAVAQAICANFPGLVAVVGSMTKCRVKATRYVFAHVDFGGPSGEGPH